MRGDTRETTGGLDLPDPYRALEHDDDATRAWMAAQSLYTERALEPSHSAQTAARIRELLQIGVLDEVAIGGERVFFTRREGDQQREALYALPLPQPEAPTKQAAHETLGAPLVDPSSYGERAALDFMVPSPDGRYVAFGISENGDERSTLRIHDVSAGKLLPEVIAHAKWSSLEWTHDSGHGHGDGNDDTPGFYYTRYPREGEADYDRENEDTYYSRVFFHRLGTDPKSDALVFAGSSRTDFPSVSLDPSDRYLVVNNFRSWTASDVWLWDRGTDRKTRALAPPEGALAPIVTGQDDITLGAVKDGQLYLTTNHDAPRKRVVRVPVENARDKKARTTVIAETSATLEQVSVTAQHLALHALENVHSQLRITSLTGEPIANVGLPARGSIEALATSASDDRIAFVWSSFFHPPTLFVYDARARVLHPLYQVAHDLDLNAYQLSQEAVPSRDGTLVNVYYVHRKDLPRDRQNPVLLRGYGGFSVSLLPEFARTALFFVERGGIYAQANLRGGGEHGEAFHRAGMFEHKPRVFEDFEAVIRWFSDSGWSRPGRIAITGGSNGGLLVGALVTRAPDTFAAAAAYVGLYDMLRYPLFPPAELWTSEYGDPTDPSAARYLAAYSPYHNVKDGRPYPAVLVETADHDTRVHFAHSTKFAARLQEANQGSRPVYFYLEKAVGHGAGTGLDDLVRRYSRQYAFLAQELGMAR